MKNRCSTLAISTFIFYVVSTTFAADIVLFFVALFGFSIRQKFNEQRSINNSTQVSDLASGTEIHEDEDLEEVDSMIFKDQMRDNVCGLSWVIVYLGIEKHFIRRKIPNYL